MYKFEKLPVWQAAMNLVGKIYRLQKNGPGIERYEFLSQLRRAICSVPLNIAEGQSSNNDREFVRYVKIARGSLYETVTVLQLLNRLYQLNVKDGLNDCFEVGRQLSCLINYLKTTQRSKIKDQR